MVILVIATVRVVSTWTVFSQTFDEGAHIAAGMEWLERGTYLGEAQHPPLARVASALGPYLAGARLSKDHDLTLFEQGNVILHSGPYLRMLMLARAGILPFFLLSIVVVWWYARDLGGDLAANAAALLYSNLPPVLAHAGLATTDMPVTAGIAATLMLLQRWLRVPGARTAALLGLAAAVAITAKFSSLLFLAVAVVVIVAVERRWPWRAAGQAALAVLVCVLSMWAVYRFRFEALSGGALDEVSFYVRGHAPSLAAYLHAVPLPMPDLFAGIVQVLMHNAEGHEAFLLGEYGSQGWWYYFPVAIAVKTPIAFLLLAVASLFLVTRRGPFLAALAIVVACLPVNVNIGIRHVLPIYPLLAVSAGCALAVLWRRGRAGRAIAIAAIVAELFVSARAHPDYLAYFNAFAGDAPERILLDSNLDWGQDLLRLERRARELKIDAMRTFYFGTANLERHNLPPQLPIKFRPNPPGWYAVSESLVGYHPELLPWLERNPKYERVGKSIRLYKLPGEPSRAEILAVMTRILVPLPLGSSMGADRRWTTALRVKSEAEAPEMLLDHRGNRRDIAPGTSMLWDAPSERTAWFLYARRGAASRIEAQIDASGTIVPAPHEGQFRSPVRMQLRDCGGCTRTLRVYSLDSGPVAIEIGLDRGKHSVTLLAEQGLPAWGQFDLKQIFGTSDGVVSIAAEGGQPLWAFVTGDGVVTSSQDPPR